ncbi:hypothetical protein SOVF_127150 [Spinacia oleracea]|nr:hypothetical protein SOVF_127150 [Spinacia oleracea]
MKEFTLTEEDIQDIFLLPKVNGGEMVIHRGVDKEEMTIIDDWKKKLNVEGNSDIYVNDLEFKMKSMKEGGDDFRKFFVMYVSSTFLAPVANRKIDTKIIKWIDNAAQIPRLNWCKFVLDNLCNAVHRLKKNKNNSAQRKGVSGCMIVLQIAYFHRLKFKEICEPYDLPLIQHWSNERIRNRVNEEAAVKFGQGELDKETYPVSMISRARISIQHEIQRDEKRVTQYLEDKSHHMERVITYNLPEGLKTNKEIQEKAEDVSSSYT